MDPMLLGETIAASNGESYLGFWQPSGGNDGVAAVETFYVSVAGAFTVQLETKSSDDDDSAATPLGSGVSISATAPQVYKFDVEGARDLVRYRIIYEQETAGVMHFQFTQPLWAPN